MPTGTNIRAACFGLALLTTVTTGRVAIAQPAPAQPAPAQPAQPATGPSARELVATGDKLQRLHLYDAALVEYRKAYAAAPLTSTLRRVADMQRELGDAEGATASYERVIAAKDVSRDDLKAAEKALAAMKAETGTLTVSASPDGATVTVDDTPLAVPPGKPFRVSARSHAIRVTKPGFEPFATTVEVEAGGSKTVTAVLVAEMTTGSVYVHDSSGRSVPFSIDGKETGTTPFRGELPAGEHAFDVTDPKLRAGRIVVNILPKQRAEVIFSSSATIGIVKLLPEPKDAVLSVDGKVLPASQREIELPYGKYILGARAPGYLNANETVSVVPGAPLEWAPRLTRTAAAPKATDQYEGGHFDVGVHGSFPIAGRVDTCPKPSAGAECNAGTALGGGLLLRGGYNWGPIGIAATVLPSVHVLEDEITYAGGAPVPGVPEAIFPHTQKVRVIDVGGMLVVGPTFATEGKIARVSGGLAGGLAVRFVSFDRTMTGQLTDVFATSDTKVGPAAAAHVSVLLGSTPGAKLELGLLMTLEKLEYSTQSSVRQVQSTSVTVPAYDVYKDIQLYLGPVLNGRFGY